MIRPARSLDAGAVGAILSEFIDTVPWMPRVHTRAEDLAHAADMIARGWVEVSCAEPEVAGFIARDAGVIHALYLTADARGQGKGRALLDRAKAAQEALSLWTFQANTGARRFYGREGFVEVDLTDGAGNDEGLPDVRLEWRRNEGALS